MRNTRRIWKILLLQALTLVGVFGCGSKPNKSSDAPPSATEESYCSSVTNVTTPVTISGTATYQYYEPNKNFGLTKDTSINPNGDPFTKPIRRAEVRVFNSKGIVVQCSETDATGAISLSIEKPTVAETFSLEVNSRSNNSSVIGSILDKVDSKKFYSLKTSFVVAADATSVSLSALVAPATGTLEGGAFHILDEILLVNEFLRNNSTDTNCSLCQNFTVAPKVTVFWAKGFNPSSYFGETSPLSFYDVSASIDTAPGLYILGGSNGDVDMSDTDHFDDSVIIHEYGHFLENTYWKSDSPGGYHDGNMIIDPRLAFSEGFSNFLPSAVTGSSTYIDTIGSPDGSADVGVVLNLEDETGLNNNVRDKIITKSPIGEGIYREVSVSRALYDYIDSTTMVEKTYDAGGTVNNADELSQLPFAYLWLALTNTSFGLKSSSQHFISMGQLNKALYSSLDFSSFADIAGEKVKLDSARIGEFQVSDTSEYAALVAKNDSACDRTMTPVADRTLADGSSYHDLFLSSDFFRIDHPGGVLDLQLSYTGTADLDLYVFKEVHTITETNDLVAKSEAVNATVGNTESVSVSLPAGTYMVFINVDTAVTFASSIVYSLTSGGKYLCNSL